MSYSSEVLADSPLLYWRLGETSGTTATDASPNARNGTYSATGVSYSVLSPVAANTAVTFDGVAGCLQSAATLDLSALSAVTVEFWLNTTFNANSKILLETSANYNSNNGAFLINCNAADGTWYLDLQSGTLYNGVFFTRPSNAAWHHCAIIIRTGIAGVGGFTVRIDKINQALTLDGANSNSIAAFGNYTVYVGARAASSLFLAGSLDEIAIYPTALSAARTDAHFDAAQAAVIDTDTQLLTASGLLTI